MSEIFASRNFAGQAIREISRIFMEFDFANQIYFIEIFAKLDFSKQKRWWNKLKSLSLCSINQKMAKKILKLCPLGIDFRELAKPLFFAEI